MAIKLFLQKTFYLLIGHFWPLKRSSIRILLGAILSVGAPSLWLASRLLSRRHLEEELSVHFDLYLYMFLGTAFVFAIFDWYLGSQEQRLKSLASHDDLTGLYNSRHFSERLAEEIAAVKRHDASLALILLDLDHFKRINDDYGHVFGNKVLRSLGHALIAIARANETLYRIGGDEFCIILRTHDWLDAHKVASRFLERIRTTIVKSKDHNPVRITASIGIAITDSRELWDAVKLLGVADKAMYEAKAKGRNRIEPVDYEIRAWRSRLAK